MIFTDESGEAIRKANHMEDCLIETNFDNTLNTKITEKITNALSMQKKALRKRFAKLFEYSMISRRVNSKDILSIAHKTEYDNRNSEFGERVWDEIKSWGTNYKF